LALEEKEREIDALREAIRGRAREPCPGEPEQGQGRGGGREEDSSPASPPAGRPGSSAARPDFNRAIQALSATVEADRLAIEADENAIALDRIAQAAEMEVERKSYEAGYLEAATAGGRVVAPAVASPPLTPTNRSDGASITGMEEDIIQRLSQSLGALQSQPPPPQPPHRRAREGSRSPSTDGRDWESAERESAAAIEGESGPDPCQRPDERQTRETGLQERASDSAAGRLHSRVEVLGNIRMAEEMLQSMPEFDPARANVAKSVGQLHLLLGLDAEIRALSPKSPDGGVLQYL